LFSTKQVKPALPTDCFKTLYYAMMAQSHFAYSIIAWRNANNSILNPLVTLQRQATGVIHNAYYNSHTEPKFKSSGILKIPDLLVYQSLIFMFDYLLNKIKFVLMFIRLAWRNMSTYKSYLLLPAHTQTPDFTNDCDIKFHGAYGKIALWLHRSPTLHI